MVSSLPRRRIRALQQASKSLLDGSFAQSLYNKAQEIKKYETGGDTGSNLGFVQGTGSRPMSMYGPEQWACCFPDLFPYGDGVFGVPRRNPLTFRQCCILHMLREELSFDVSQEHIKIASAWLGADPAAGTAACTCSQCVFAFRPYNPPELPRWRASRELLCCEYDSGRRMEQIKKARGHVTRPGYHERLEKICNCSLAWWLSMEAFSICNVCI